MWHIHDGWPTHHLKLESYSWGASLELHLSGVISCDYMNGLCLFFAFLCAGTRFDTFVLSCSLRGKQVHQVPTELTNGVHNILALHDSGQVNAKERSSGTS